MSCKKDYTLTYDERVEGWTSFHSFFPDFMLGMNNSFYSLKGGDLFLHHSDNVDRNNYYGTNYPSKISVMVNDSPNYIKELLTVSLEGNDSWEVLLRAFVSNVDDEILSSIKYAEFVKKEGIWYAYARRNEELHFDSKSSYGIGSVINISGNDVTFNGNSTSLCVGDTVLKGDLTSIGVITAINGNILTLDSVVGLSVTDFILGIKDPRIEGGNLRGYTMRFDLENETYDRKVELFAVNAEVIKSFT